MMNAAYVIGLGHDMQLIAEVDGCAGLLERDVMFTRSELAAIQKSTEPARSMASLFSCKEAFFKAIPMQQGWHWSELELTRDERGRPHFVYSGQLRELMHSQQWSARVSLSHSGQYVSCCVLIQQATSHLPRARDNERTL